MLSSSGELILTGRGIIFKLLIFKCIIYLDSTPFRCSVYYSELTVFGLLSSPVFRSLRQSAAKIKIAGLLGMTSCSVIEIHSPFEEMQPASSVLRFYSADGRQYVPLNVSKYLAYYMTSQSMAVILSVAALRTSNAA